jgi:predicted GIY-YIG superfamily endonuclease
MPRTQPNKKRSNVKWTFELLKNSASKYSSVKEWRTNESSAYAIASMRGLLKKLTKDMTKLKVDPWNKAKVLKSAKKYTNKGDWAKYEGSAYRNALKEGWIDEATSHMDILGNKYKRCLYSISVKGTKKIYIGLSGNFKRRKRDHLETKRFTRLIKQFGKNSIIFKQLTEYILVEDAIKLERKLENDFRKKGYEVLNKARPGGIGGTTVKWTKKNIIKSANRFNLLRDWRNKDPEAYNGALRLNIVKEVSNHMQRIWEKKWTYKNVLDSAKKFNTKEPWRKAFPGAYLAARRLGIYKKVTKHMKVLSPRGKWTKEVILKNAKKFKTQAQWRKNFDGAFHAALSMGILKKATKHMIDGRSLVDKKWTEKNIIKSAKKFKILKEWREKESGAYSASLKLKITKKVSKHMKRVWKTKWNKKNVMQSAKKFKLSSYWKARYPSAPAAARRLGIYKKATKHMIDGRFKL